MAFWKKPKWKVFRDNFKENCDFLDKEEKNYILGLIRKQKVKSVKSLVVNINLERDFVQDRKEQDPTNRRGFLKKIVGGRIREWDERREWLKQINIKIAANKSKF